MRLRALTLQQPWGSAVMQLGKTIENRTTNVVGSYRGPIAIHVGLKYDTSAPNRITIAAGRPLPADTRLFPGCVLGVVDLVGVHQWPHCSDGFNACSPWAEQKTVALRHGETWRSAGVWHLELANPRPIAQPFHATGQQGVWYLTDEQTARVCDELGMVLDG